MTGARSLLPMLRDYIFIQPSCQKKKTPFEKPLRFIYKKPLKAL
jgi:hypothetical protein